MKAAIISFSRNGRELSKQIADFLRKENYQMTEAVKSVYVKDSIQETLKEWTKEQFYRQDVLIFVGAVGIAVRAIGPLAESKCEDPAVLVMDESGRFCIPLLSGHIGGANALAEKISDYFGMQAVLTTATDVREKWAVDVFAVKNNLMIQDMKKAKMISARLVNGERVSCFFESKIPVHGECPKELILLSKNSKDIPDIYSGIYEYPSWEKTLFLIPKVVIMGVGCKKGTPMEVIEQITGEAMRREKLCLKAICAVASIDLKAEEKGILDYCEKYHLKFYTYSSTVLSSVEGVFSASDFVKKTTGVDNICERSAVCASEGGQLLSRKYARNGVTVAFAEKIWEAAFE